MDPHPIHFLPDEIANATFVCTSCKREAPVPLKTMFAHPVAAVIPKDFDARSNNKFWQLQLTEISCPLCEQRSLIPLPTLPEKGKVLLYGDDAWRDEREGQIFCFSVVGACHPDVHELEKRVHSLKRQLLPSRGPLEWRLHMKELLSGDRRRKHAVYSTWTREDVDRTISNLYHIVSTSPHVFCFNVSVFRRSRGDLDDLKRQCYLGLLMDLTDRFTGRGFTPIFHFDSEKQHHGLGPVIHRWAQKAFTDGQRQLAYAYLSHGLPVAEPKFVKPGSHACLELADFVAYVVAREHRQRMKGLTLDTNTERLGNLFYSWMNKRGDYVQQRRVGFPWGSCGL